ncbi:MAG: hypothetical protein ACI81P_003484, partial [Neolewinella sp.]
MVLTFTYKLLGCRNLSEKHKLGGGSYSLHFLT